MARNVFNVADLTFKNAFIYPHKNKSKMMITIFILS
mgnify:CR=1 FL=1